MAINVLNYDPARRDDESYGFRRTIGRATRFECLRRVSRRQHIDHTCAATHVLNTQKRLKTRPARAAACAIDRAINRRRRRGTTRRERDRAARTHDSKHHTRTTIAMDADAGSSARLYVGNIPWSTTIDDLRELFAECGGVTRVDIPTGRQGRSRGYGLVEFNSEAEAQAAVTRMDGA